MTPGQFYNPWNQAQPDDDGLDYMPHDFNEVVVKTGPYGGAVTDPNAHPLAAPPPPVIWDPLFERRNAAMADS